MRSLSFYGAFIVSCFTLIACERAIVLMPRNEKPTLVVEGTVTNLPPPYVVQLSYSGNYSRSDTVSDGLYINDATVTISDDLGNTTQCLPAGQGRYLSSDSTFLGTVGRTYKVVVILVDGTRYESGGETMQPVAPVEKVNVS